MKMNTKITTILLAIILVLQIFIPTGFQIQVYAEEQVMGGTSSSTLEQLRIPPDPISLGAEKDNPYGPGVFNMYPRMELAVANHFTDKLTIYDYDKGETKQIFNDENRISEKKRSDFVSTKASASVAVDAKNTGRKEYIARVMVDYGVGKAKFTVSMEDKTGNVIRSRDLKTLGFESDQGASIARGSLQITAGDYNGDGYQEFAVFSPYGDATYGNIEIYNAKSFLAGSTSPIKTISIKSLIDSEAIYSYSDWENVPVVHLTSGNLTDENSDQLVITVSGKWGIIETYTLDAAASMTTIYSYDKEEGSYNQKFQMKHAWDYTQYDSSSESKNTQIGGYGSASVGDIDGDHKNDLVLASLDFSDDTRTSKNPKLHKKAALVSVVKYNAAKKEFEAGAGGVAQSLLIHSAVASGTYNETQGPVSLECFKAFGTGEAEAIFLQGQIYSLVGNSDEGAYYEGAPTANDHPARQYKYKDLYRTPKIFDRDDKVYYGEKYSKTINIWIDSVVSGNFMNNENGCEQIIFAYGRKRDSKSHEYRHDIVSIYGTSGENFDSGYIRYENNRNSPSRDFLDLTAVDIDNDGVLMSYKSKAAYFSNPNVVAVLQAAPYFTDLESLNEDYIEDGSTAFGKSTGSGSADANGFEISASAITGFKQETSFFGLARLGGCEFQVDIHASMGGEWEKASEKTYSTDYESNSLDDRVILSMVPYIRYVYEVYIPAFKIPTKAEYDAEVKRLKDSYALDNYKDEVASALAKGYTYGQTVAAYTTEYIVSMPQDIRMSMISASMYDKVAEANGYDKVQGNILNQTIGDPATYSSSNLGLKDFDGGKSTVNSDDITSNDGFIYVSKGGGTVTQSIEESTSSSSSVTWGAGVSATLQSDIGGVIVGGSMSADYTGSHTTSEYTSTSYSGTIAGMPDEATDLGYDFQWKFGRWQDKLNGETCLVLGYLTKNVLAPPSVPSQIAIKDTTDTTITLNWSHPSNKGGQYDIFMVTDNEDDPYHKLATLDSNTTEFVAKKLAPNTSYTFVMRSIDGIKKSVYSMPCIGKTQYSPDANVLRMENPKDQNVVAGAEATFSVEARPADDGGYVFYQWQLRDIDGTSSSWTNMKGEVSRTLKISQASSNEDGNEYRCRGSQLIDGSVTYVYTNPARLNVGMAGSSTTLELSGNIGPANGNYEVIEESTESSNVGLTGIVDGTNYSVVTYGDDSKYALLLKDSIEDTSTIRAYLIDATDDKGNIKIINDAITNKNETVTLDKDGLKSLESVYEYCTEDGTSTGISEDAVLTTPGGKITVDGVEKTYNRLIIKGTQAIYEISFSEEGAEGEAVTEYYYTSDTNAATPDYTLVSVDFIGYKGDGEDLVDLSNTTDVMVEASRKIENITIKETDGSPVTLTAIVNAEVIGLNVIPKGVVEFEIAFNNDISQIIRKTVQLSPTGQVNQSGANYQWTPNQEGVYTIKARYKGDTKLMHSTSENDSYEAYVVNPELDTQTKKQLILSGSNEITYGQSINFDPKLKTTDITSDNSGNNYTSSEKSVKGTRYDLTFKNGDSVEASTISGNIFVPKVPGIYIISAFYGEEQVSTRKTVQVNKIPITIRPKKVTTGLEGIKAKLEGMKFDDDHVEIVYTKNPEIPVDFITGDDYKYDEKAFFIIDTDAKENSTTGVYTIRIGEEKSEALLQGEGWLEKRKDFFLKYEVSYETATFIVTGKQHKLSFEAGANGKMNAYTANGIEIINNKEVEKGSLVQMKAIPNSGYSIDYWMVDGEKYTIEDNIVTADTIEVEVDKDKTVSVFFTSNKYSVKFSVAELYNHGKISATYINSEQKLVSPESVFSGSQIQFYAEPNDGFTVGKWLVKSDENTITVKNSDGSNYAQRGYVLQNIDNDYEVEVVFVKEEYYDISAIASDAGGNHSPVGTIQISGGVKNDKGQYQNGSALTIKAVPVDANTSQIREWRLYNGDTYKVLQGNTSEYTIENLQNSCDIRVVFESISQRKITFSPVNENGEIWEDISMTAVSNGVNLTSGEMYQTNVPIEFKVDLPEGYALTGWNINGTIETSSKDTYMLDLLTDDSMVKAVIRKLPVITVGPIESGSIIIKQNDKDLESGAYVPLGSDILIRVIPNEGYVVASIYGEDVNTAKSNGEKDYILANISEDVTITGQCIAKPIIRIIEDPNASITARATVDSVNDKIVSDGDYADYGSNVEFIVRPGKGYFVDSMDAITMRYFDGTGNTTDDMMGTKTNLQTDFNINPSIGLLDVFKIEYRVVDTSDNENATYGRLSRKIERKEMAVYEDVYQANSTINFADVYEEGTIRLTADPDEEYRVKEWIINDQIYKKDSKKILDKIINLRPNQDMKVTVQFEKGDSRITFDENPLNGELAADVNGESFISGGTSKEEVHFAVVPDENYVVTRWFLNGNEVPGDYGTEFTYKPELEQKSGESAHISVEILGRPLEITCIADEGGTVSGLPEGQIRYNTNLTFMAFEKTGYNFEGWYKNGNPIENPSSEYNAGIQTENADYRAKFAANTYNIQYNVNNPMAGRISATANDKYFRSDAAIKGGAKIVFKVDLNEEYYVKEWIGAEGGRFNEDMTTCTFDVVGENMNVEAVMEPKAIHQITIIEPTHGRITAMVNGEAVTEVMDGIDVTFTFIPDRNYMLKTWTDDGKGQTQTQFTTTINKAYTIGAEAVDVVNYKFKYSIIGDGGTCKAGSNGKSIKINTEVDCIGGSLVKLTAIPNEGKMVKTWYINGEKQNSYGKTLEITISEITNVEVDFEDIVLYELPKSVEGQYIVTVEDRIPSDLGEEYQIRKNGSVRFVVAPEAGRYFTELNIGEHNCIEDSQVLSIPNNMTVDKTEDGSYRITIKGVTDEITHTISTELSEMTVIIKKPDNGKIEVKNGMILVENGESVAKGTELTITAIPDPAYRLSKWLGSISGSKNPLLYTVTEDFGQIEIDGIMTKSSGGSGGGGGGAVNPQPTVPVNFDTQGGSTVAVANVYVNQTVKEPASPIKEGYEFAGWFTDIEATKEFDFGTKILSEITLYAKWTAELVEEWLNPFEDVSKDDWFFDSVKYVNENELMNGVIYNMFEPNAPITRGMFATVLYRMEGTPEVTGSYFEDIESGAYYEKAVIWAAENEIVKGFSPREYAPDKKITREQMATILHRYAQYKKITFDRSIERKIFKDNKDISDYAVEAVSFCTKTGIILGREGNQFMPGKDATRAEAATVFMRFLEFIKN